ncbi:MAG: SDR family NAD(P)-dependent oxidoreductase, partial [Cytophagaceae bacterium]
KIDVLVNDAGIQFVSPIEDFPDEKWEAIIGINLSASFYTCKAVWKGMKEKKYGRIINIASAHGLVASEFKSAYVAAKHGLVGLTQNAALEYAAKGIRVNCVGPAFIKTPLLDVLDSATMDFLVTQHPIGRLGRPEEVAELVVWLSSEKASFVTGSYYPVDGGYLSR